MCLLVEDIRRHVCSFLDIIDLVNAELIAVSWMTSVLPFWNKTCSRHYLGYKHRFGYTDKQRALTAWRDANIACPDILLIGGAFGSLESHPTILHTTRSGNLSDQLICEVVSAPSWKKGWATMGAMASTVDSHGESCIFGGWSDVEDSICNSISTIQLSDHTSKINNIADVLFPRCYASATTSIEGYIYLTGGSDSPYQGAQVYRDGFLLGVGDDRWNMLTLPHMNIARCGHSSVTSFGDDIIVLGGYQGERSYLSSVEKYDTGSERWVSLPNMSVPRSGFGCAVGECGSVYVAGGSPNGTVGHVSSERLDLREGKWQKLSDMGRARGYSAACMGTHGKFFISGGVHSMHFQNSIEYFDPRKGIWNNVPMLSGMEVTLGKCLSRASHHMILLTG
jgi:hypothetical protein